MELKELQDMNAKKPLLLADDHELCNDVAGATTGPSANCDNETAPEDSKSPEKVPVRSDKATVPSPERVPERDDCASTTNRKNLDASTPKAGMVQMVEQSGQCGVNTSAQSASQVLRVTRVHVEGTGAVDRLEMTYSDGTKWSMGKPYGGKRILARDLILGDDEYLVEVKHEPLQQWWWTAASLEFRTNKGRVLKARGDWGSGLDEDCSIFTPERGRCILRLNLHNGLCRGIVEGVAPEVDEFALKLWAVYWLSHGSDIKDVQGQNFTRRDTAYRFVEEIGGGPESAIMIGPLRIEMDDHPWLDCLHDLKDVLRRAWHRRNPRRNSRRSGNSNGVEGSARELPFGSSESPYHQFGSVSAESQCAGLVIDIVGGKRVRSWGPIARRRECEAKAFEDGQFDLKRWRFRSTSFITYVERWQGMLPVLQRIMTMMQWRQHVVSSAVMFVSTMARSICDGLQPVFTGAVFNLVHADEAEVKKESAYLHFICSWTFGCQPRLTLAKSVILGLLIISFFRGIAKVGMQSAQKSLREKYRSQARIELFEHLLSQDLGQFEKSSARAMMNKAKPQTVDGAVDWVLSLLQCMVRLASSLFFLFSISPLMTFTYAALLPLFEGFVQSFLRGGARGASRRERGMEATADKVIWESCDMIKTVKTFSREDWHVALQRYAVQGATAARLTIGQAIAQVGEDTLHQAIYCFSLWCGLVWMDNDFSSGEMTAFLLLITKVGRQAKDANKQIASFLDRQDTLKEYFEFLDQTPTVQGGTHKAPIEGHVVLEEVCFRYPTRPDQLVLDKVCLSLAPGKITALVGASGSGKSTVVNLLLRHYDPSQGTVVVDGQPLQNWDLTYLHRHMAVVSQEPLLFETTIKQNLLYGVIDATLESDPGLFEEEMIEAAKNACAHDFIMAFPSQYNTHCGDRGSQMSGGQKQRLAVARAMLMRPRILILDEATSALDAESEGVVQEAIDNMVKNSGSAVLMIAHRLSTVKDADEIVCLREGSVIERGSPRALLDQQGYYFRLVHRQVITLDDIKGANKEMDGKPTVITGRRPPAKSL